ncbi:MAG: ATP-binding protein [Bacteroidetes bacterium]|nr:ATP-binding protein [Bacteroidota bacterium]
MAEENELPGTRISTAGTIAATINVTFSPQFLALLSEHLYSSPNKAFEELVSNSWDANATSVHIHIPDSLHADTAAIWILDNGTSMNVAGLEQLWSIAASSKRGPLASGRKQIGKFGIGKLATYVLCNELTYICKASDGVIRIVTMDYRLVDEAGAKHLESLPLNVREIANEEELEKILSTYELGAEIGTLIKSGVPPTKTEDYYDEFGGSQSLVNPSSGTWTLAVLTSLKDSGKSIQAGWINWLLRTALPLGNSISICLNKTPITASKSDTPVQKNWKIGPALEFDKLELEDGTVINVEKFDTPYPHVKIESVGEITGESSLFEDNIRGGKSDKIRESNGFFVNVLGRVINPEDNLFKLVDLNLSVLAQFRATIRVDGLDNQISANREAIADSLELKIVKAFLKKLFNLARREYNKREETLFSDVNKVKRDEITSVPAVPLNNLLKQVLEHEENLPVFVSVENKANFITEKNAWIEATKDNIGAVLEDIQFEDREPQDLLAKYDLKTRHILINRNHPFAKENSQTSEQRNTLADTAVADLLTDAYLLNCGISSEVYYDIAQHRDRVLRALAQIRRSSAAQIITSLTDWTNSVKPFEEIVGDALEYIGFSVERYGGNGEPEGVATAFISPTNENEKSVYSLTYDAKSTKHKKAQTGNLHIAGLARHREEYNANFAVVMATDFQNGALGAEATSNRVSPLKAATLAKLVAITVGYGPVSLIKLKELFSIYTPAGVDAWVNSLEEEMKNSFSIDLKIFVRALETLITPNRIDILGCDSIAQKYRELGGLEGKPSRTDIAQLCRGLSLVAPSIIFIDPSKGFDVFLLTKPAMLIQEIQKQTQGLPKNLKVGILNETEST